MKDAFYAWEDIEMTHDYLALAERLEQAGKDIGDPRWASARTMREAAAALREAHAEIHKWRVAEADAICVLEGTEERVERLRALLREARAMCEDGDGLIDSEKLAARIDAAIQEKP